MSEILAVNDQNFSEEVLKSSLPVLVDFWAPWCGPCRMVAPVVEAVAQEYNGKLKVVKLNTDDSPTTAQQFNIISIPSLFIFKEGKVVDSLVGALPKPKLQEMVDRHVS